MPDRKMSNKEKSKPCANLTIWYPIKFSFSLQKEKYEKWQEKLREEGKTVNNEANKWFLSLFNVKNFQDWKKKNKEISQKIDKLFKDELKNKLGLETTGLSYFFSQKVEEDLSKETLETKRT